MDDGITVSFDYQMTVDQSAEDAWQDFDHSDDWDAAELASSIKESYRSLADFLRDFDPRGVVKVYVSKPNPAYGGDRVLFGDVPEKRLRSQAEITW